MWSIGVLAYMLLASALPFECEDRNRSFSVRRKVTIEKIQKNKLTFKEERWKSISAEAKEFIKALCKTNIDKRWTAHEASKSTWIQKQSKLSDFIDGDDDEDGLLEKISRGLQDYSKASDLKKLGLLILAHRTPTTGDIVKLRKVFQKLDYENDGVITVNEFKGALGSLYPESDLDKMFHGIDIEQNGTIGYSEFLAATFETMFDLEENKLREVFSILDEDNTGFVSQKKLQEILGRECKNGSISELLNETDLVLDAEISVDEFLDLFHFTKRKKANTVLGPLMVS
uniref:Calmodulin n=1 Tax=Leptocylindrus danicus TaxID=163516 RepID=A0A7S2KZR3_9STRA